MNPPDIELRHVGLRYDDGTEALDDLTLRIEGGAVCGLLGRNGAGKSSLLGLLASHRRPTSGEVLIGGRAPFEDPAVAGQVALIGESGTDSTSFAVRDVVRLAGMLRPTWDTAYAEALLERFEVPPKTSVGKLSRGSRALLGAICGLASRAPVTIFDEAHLGMDVPTRYAFYDELLRDVIAHPRTVVLSTHHIDEVASLFSEVVILDRGRLLLHDDVDDLRARGVEVTGPAEAVDRFTAGRTVLGQRQLGPTRSVVVDGALDAAERRRAVAEGLELGPVPLQDLFVHLTEGRAPEGVGS